MRRSLVSLVGFTALAAWAGGQGPPPPLPAADRVRLFRADQTLINSLVDHGVTLGNADNPLARADGARKAALSLATALKRVANDDRDADRAAELADLLAEVVRDGLTPNLDEATRTFPPGTPQAADLARLRAAAAADLDAVREAVPADGPVGGSPRANAALERLAALKAALGK
jgi:hypothetical protein